jgi:hypothetical protein
MLAGTVSAVDIFESALRNARNEMDALMTKGHYEPSDQRTATNCSNSLLFYAKGLLTTNFNSIA